MYFIDYATVQDLEYIRSFPIEDDDVLVIGFVKSGTSWLQVMITNLFDELNTCGGELRKVPSLHGRNRVAGKYYGYEDCVSLTPPRLMKSHLPRELMPGRWPDHGKVVHISRNPKDVCISLFHELNFMGRTAPGSPTAVSEFSAYFQKFMIGQVPWAPIADHLLSWSLFDHPNLLKITYEDALRNTRATLGSIVDFIGRPVSEERIDQVVRTTEFKAMRESSLRYQINHPDLREDTDAPFMRKGIIGDWKNVMTVAQNELFDREIVHRLEDNGVFMSYE